MDARVERVWSRVYCSVRICERVGFSDFGRVVWEIICLQRDFKVGKCEGLE